MPLIVTVSVLAVKLRGAGKSPGGMFVRCLADREQAHGATAGWHAQTRPNILTQKTHTSRQITNLPIGCFYLQKKKIFTLQGITEIVSDEEAA